MALGAWAEDVTVTLEGESMLEDDSPSTSYADHTTGLTDSGDNTWVGRWTYAKSNKVYLNMIQLKQTESSNSSRIVLPVFPGYIKSITLKATNASTSSTSYEEGTATNATLFLVKGTTYTTKYIKNEDNQVLLIENPNSTIKDYVFDFTKLDKNYTGQDLFIASSGGIRIWGIEVVYEKIAKVDVSGVSIDKDKLDLIVSESVNLSATVSPDNATNKTISWSSSNTDVATVTSTGLVKALQEGQATITVTTQDNNCTAQCTVNVSAPKKTGNVYTKITADESDWTGKYLIVYESGTENRIFDASLATIDVSSNYITAPSENNIILGDVIVDASAFTIEKTSDGYSIMKADGKYIGIGGTSNGLSTNAKQSTYKNLISYNTTDKCTEITITNSGTEMILNYNSNSGQERFRYFNSSLQKPIQLYKLSSSTLPVSTVGFSTYYNSLSAYTMPEGCEGLTAKYENGTLTLNPVYKAGDVVPAGEPLIIRAAQNTYTLNFVASDAKPSTDNDLLGTDEATELEDDADSYFYALSLNDKSELNSVGFYWMKEDGLAFTNGAHKAYLKINKNESAIKQFVFADDETAISTVSKAADAAEAIYSDSGARQNTLKKGINIVKVGGQVKKVYVK